jgi:glycosyltransferase involved in cell wall biosynthesis
LKICFIVDARSPIALNWIRYFIGRADEVTIISFYSISRNTIAGAKVHQFPIALSSFSGASQAISARTANNVSKPPALAGLRRTILSKLSIAAQHSILPFDVHRQVAKVRNLIAQASPDLVHAMRIPFEGIVAAKATPAGTPLLISVWGNDFTLWAARNPIIARQTRQALGRANSLHCDCHRDLALAYEQWGFDSGKLATVLPGAGGIETSLFRPGEPKSNLRDGLNIPSDAPVIINPRGFRAYVRNDVFFQSIPLVLREYPEAVFINVGMEANPIAERWMSQLSIKESVRLLPSVPHNQMADLFRMARVAVSPSLHDGTPNTLLEAMACGCLPVAFDIESVREWITDEVNGLLCAPNDAASLARAIVRALGDDLLREEARQQNLQLIAERAEYDRVMQQAESFYLEVIRQKRQAAEV